MTLIRRAILALALIAGITPAIAAPPPPVPSVQDIERRTQYTITASTCACAVNYSVFGDGTDYQKWVEVWLNGVRVNYNDSVFGWTLTSPTGPVGLIPRPIIDAVVTFTRPQTGTVQIVGARVPRRISQFNTRNATSRDLDVAFSDLVTMMRETWDRTNSVTGRALLSQPGVTMGNLPLPLTCQSAFLGFDAAGNNPVCRSSSGTGNVTLPVIDGDLVVFDGIHGLLKDGGGNPKNLLPVYVDDYCTVVDGVTNNTACISAAITAANGIREVKFSSRAEYCVDPIKIGDGGLPVPPRMGGDSGFATSWVACGSSASATLTYSNFSFDTASSVHDLRIRANGLHPTGLLIHGCQFCSFERVRVQGATGYGWVIHGEPGYNVQYNSFRDVVSRGNNGGGFRFYSDNNAGDYYVAANACSGLRAQSNLGDGINIDYATVDCNGAEFESNTGYGINFNHTKAGVWNPAHVEGNTAGGINVTANTTNLHFQGGRIDAIAALLLSCASCSIDQTDGAGQNNGFLRPTGIAVGAMATDPSTGNINLGGGALFNNGVAPVGSGAYVRATGPAVSNLQVTGSLTATGLVTVADLTNPSVTVNGVTCTLGSSCAPTAAASGMAVGTTTVTSGTTTRVLYDNAGVLGEYTISGTGNVAMTTNPAFTTPNLGTPSALTLTNATGLPTTGLTGTLLAAQMPALTGACTTSAGAVATSCIINTPISISGSNTGSLTAGASLYYGAGIMAGAPAVSAFPMMLAGTVKGLTCYVSTAPGVGQTDICTVYRGVNGAVPTATTMTCTISGTANVCATPDTTHTFTVAINDVVVMQVTASAGAASAVNASGQIILATASP